MWFREVDFDLRGVLMGRGRFFGGSLVGLGVGKGISLQVLKRDSSSKDRTYYH